MVTNAPTTGRLREFQKNNDPKNQVGKLQENNNPKTPMVEIIV